MSHVRDRHERRRKLEREQEGAEHRVNPEEHVRPSVIKRAKQHAHQRLRRVLHALLNLLPQRQDNQSTWMTTTTDDALSIAAKAHGAVEVRRDRALPLREPLRSSLYEHKDEEVKAPHAGARQIQPPQFDPDLL